MKKAPTYFAEKDVFKREYLKRSLQLIMKNSFLTSLIKEYGLGSMMPHQIKHSPVSETVE